ncbi:heme NO-binding domain-containing protein [Ruficoccus amylovorans]|uniref:Heme NO-binding domain-containing protein n=1 Tax=Ruficoccus amylovorans TaxID=1804625 RepID=A0A842HGU4_9BACT|nr:heme NO-binding domain-containing protein [Ruficoccus amylovorans]MBC2595400.1 heme NO-binding domain-containing protein [Ruficoccus amylovorans]
MKGIVFTEFLEMVESRFGVEMTDVILEEADLPMSRGAYTAVGTYPHSEMVSLVTHLSGHSGLSVPDLLKSYGEHLFGRFHALYPGFFRDGGDAFDFLTSIHEVIHVEVKKLYPDAELPSFLCSSPEPGVLRMHYISSRQMQDFAEGLIIGCLKHFNQSSTIEKELQPDGTTIFLLRKGETDPTIISPASDHE